MTGSCSFGSLGATKGTTPWEPVTPMHTAHWHVSAPDGGHARRNACAAINFQYARRD
jgi:hypothetical protein